MASELDQQVQGGTLPQGDAARLSALDKPLELDSGAWPRGMLGGKRGDWRQNPDLPGYAKTDRDRLDIDPRRAGSAGQEGVTGEPNIGQGDEGDPTIAPGDRSLPQDLYRFQNISTAPRRIINHFRVHFI